MTLINFHKPDEVLMQKASDNHGIFEFSPLERGYGVTIGNALRRTLLSSLEGFAITSVKIEGIDHEFSSLSGVYEDMIEIVLNLKQVRLKQLEGGDDEETLSLSVSGQEQLTAKEISKASNNFHVLNEEHVICHMEPSVTINMELTIHKGRGYVSGEDNKPEEAQIGLIPIDAIFTPIRNVNYKVENTRVGQSVDYDKLTMDVQTDGSIHPRDAIKEASRILIEHLSLFSDQAFTVGEDADHDNPIMDDEYLHMRKLLNTSLKEWDISVRAYNCLKSANIHTVGNLVKYKIEDLLKFRNFGKKSLNELQEIVEEKGLEFGMDVSQYIDEDNEKQS